MAPMTTSDLAQVLYTTRLQASDHPTAALVRAAITDRLRVVDALRCAAYVAQEAGDHPDEYATRMRWALATVSNAYAFSRTPTPFQTRPPCHQAAA
ncbi:hypothetical protein ACGFNU_17270 [Spirillospora sp. NPDC048911]|uniref:hypothetical protein n=1 Tax=Spirillospora sp. NPDC048911 TaxID=3364527 RepID=UPI003712C301